VSAGRSARLWASAFALALLCAQSASAALGPPATLDRPSPDIVALDAVALAPDGGGALVYRKLASGAPHVFASLETSGVWAAPVQVDTGVAAGASASAVAVASGGRVAVVWAAAGTLYGAVRALGATAFSAPQAIAATTGVPALGMGVSGTAYVAFTAADGAASDIDVARLDRTSTSFVPLGAALNPTAVALASVGGGPSITVAADATAVVAWAQTQPDGSTHVFLRRASAAGPSPVLDDATAASLDGLAGGSADSPSLGVEYDASVVWVAFRETLGGFSRLLVTKLLGDELQPPALADSLAGAAGPNSALAPSLAVDGNGGGLLAGEIDPGNKVVVAALGTAATPFAWNAGTVVSAAAQPVAPRPLAASSPSGGGAVVEVPAAGALAAVPFKRGTPSGAPLSLSTAPLGPVVAADGFAAGADDRGDLVVGFIAGAPGALSVAAQPIVVAPGTPRATGTELWIAQSRPKLRWQPAADAWAKPAYSVYLDGTRVATTAATSYTPPSTLPDGRHSWKVVATDALGQSSSSQTRRLLIDAARPSLALVVSGGRGAGTQLGFHIKATAISGVRRVSLHYGDGDASTAPDSTHAFAKPGRYTVTVTVLDRAGVQAVLRERVTIT
jgi:hypothetical protein